MPFKKFKGWPHAWLIDISRADVKG